MNEHDFSWKKVIGYEGNTDYQVFKGLCIHLLLIEIKPPSPPPEEPGPSVADIPLPEDKPSYVQETSFEEQVSHFEISPIMIFCRRKSEFVLTGSGTAEKPTTQSG